MDGESQNAVAKASFLGKINHKHQQIGSLINCTVPGFLLTSQRWAGAHGATALGCPGGSCCAGC